MQAAAPDEPIEVVIPEKSPTPSQAAETAGDQGKLNTARLFSGITVHAAVDPITAAARPRTNGPIRRVMSAT